MKLLVIIVTYNGMQWIDKCLGSLKTSTIKPDVYIVDNGSTDGTQTYIQKNFPDTMFHQSKENLGFGRANNLGLQYAIDHKYDYVYLLNQDAWVFPETFELIIDAMSKNPDFGILSPLQCQANGQHLDKMFLKCISSGEQTKTIFNNVLLGYDMSQPYEVGMTMAAHWMISRKCLLQVGGFSPTFPHYGEDVNYNDRLHFWNLKMGIVPAAKAIHDREIRVTPLNKVLYIYKMVELRYLSNPNRLRKPWILNFFSNVFLFVFKYHTLSYIPTFISIIKQMKTIKKNKVESKKVCAFLNKK